VDQVVAVHRAIEELDPFVPLLSVNGIACPHHSRFAAEDRRLLDAEIERVMGKGAPAAGRIVCSSQTVEQSLDIDADFLITDLCPIDVLLQRVGRLHRHERQDRPAEFLRTRCLVLLPEILEPVETLLRFGLGPDREGGGVYPDIAGLEAVRRLIGAGAVWTIPDDNRRLVESGTDPATLNRLAADLGPQWLTAHGRRLGAAIADGQFARMNLIDRSHLFDGNYERFGLDEKIQTRIGTDRVEVPFAEGTIGPFGEAVTRIGVPGPWHIEGITGATGREWQATAPGRLSFAQTGVTYDRFGLSRKRDCLAV
jgi:CRISPR-associated endonuclease/helicase Cas3